MRLILSHNIHSLVIDAGASSELPTQLATASALLCSCALVCHGWLPMARFNFYKHIVLYRCKSYILLSRGFSHSHNLACLVRMVQFDLNGLRLYPSDASLIPFAPHAISRLSSLKMVTFFCPSAATCIFLPWASTFGICQTLATLRLREIVFDYFEYMVELVWSLPGIKTLEINECSWVERTRHPLDPMNQYPGRCAHLTELKLVEAIDVATVLGVFASPVIKNLLTLSPFNVNIQARPGDYAALATYVKLTELDLILDTTDLAWVAEALSHVRRGGLQVLSVTHWYASHQDRHATLQNGIDIRLDDLLSTSHHSALRRLAVCFLCESTRNDVDEYET
ncbi:hypothetical protein K466DRAFT_618531 [Polyporus arcularius HHB13444]|uniref:F-box domain-containing protein n=1 Tax=Polyporus arcularius HHB13444 TaxID=1314778 RepID=A0A5C3Q4A9_9APHY|nr:hypothetical protein K466DRAFT_618531 [Polyporus arcularius HHB13444]